MISALAEKVVDYMISSGIISDQEKDLYVYGFFMLLSRLLFLLMSVLFGILFDVPAESIVFYFAFFILRSYAGGIHAGSEAACTVLTSLSMFLSVMLIKLCTVFSAVILPGILLPVSSLAVMLLCPIDTPEKRLSAEEKKIYKKKTAFVLAVIVILGVTALILRRYGFFFACIVSIVLESVLLVCARLRERGKKERA